MCMLWARACRSRRERALEGWRERTRQTNSSPFLRIVSVYTTGDYAWADTRGEPGGDIIRSCQEVPHDRSASPHFRSPPLNFLLSLAQVCLSAPSLTQQLGLCVWCNSAIRLTNVMRTFRRLDASRTRLVLST